MTGRSLQGSTGENMAYGASAGFVAGKVMLQLMMLAAILVSMLPPEASLLLRAWRLALAE